MNAWSERSPESPEDARLLIHEYIKRCEDVPNCNGIGRPAHIAKITSKDFAWIGSPKNH